MADLLVGRDAELAAAAGALAGHGVVIDGPAGIGKTAIWHGLVAELSAGGTTVLRAAPTEAERLLPYAALADILRGRVDTVTDLPKPQADAARAVTVSGEVTHPVDERTVAAMVHSVLASCEDTASGAGRTADAVAAGVADQRPVLAIDDCQWLDAPSERALRYALRRLDPGPRLLLTLRGDGRDPLPLGLADSRRIERIMVPPLGIGAMHHVLQQQLGVTLNRPLLTRLTTESEGNPMLAVELARAVLRMPSLPRADEDLPVARSVQDLVAATLASLPERTLTALRLVALHTAPSTSDLRAIGVDPADLDPAEVAGLIDVRDGPRFRHPLQATAVRTGIPHGLRRRLQLRIAAAVTDLDERARQLARAISDPDEAVAAELEASGLRQWARGVPALAADLLDRGAALTPPSAAQARARRMLAALRARYDGGDHAATAAAADRAASRLSGNDRAQALLIAAVVAFVTEGHPPAIRIAENALAHADPTGEQSGRIHAHLGVFDDRPERAVQHGLRALELIPDDQNPDHRDLRCSAMLMVFYNEVRAGLPPRLDLLERALQHEGERPPWLAGSVPGLWWTAVDEHGRARDRMRRQIAHARVTGDEPLQLEVLLHLVQSLMLDGCWDEADRQLAQARALGEQLGGGLDEQDYLQAQLGIYRGDVNRYAPIVTAGLDRARRENDNWGMRVYGVLWAQLALHSGDYRGAAAGYAQLATAMTLHGLVEPLALRWEPDWIESCVGAGDLDLASDVLQRLAERHRRLPRPWTALGLARSRVLLHAARRQETRPALSELDDALATVPTDVLPLDRARCRLVAGVAHRRARRRGRARDELTAALAGFEALGARAFEARARAELGRCGVRTGATEPTALTPTERRVATLAARGRTNRAIAETLFISPKTVEANLARAYRKLGISSRAELGATLGGGADGSVTRR